VWDHWAWKTSSGVIAPCVRTTQELFGGKRGHCIASSEKDEVAPFLTNHLVGFEQSTGASVTCGRMELVW
jgi:hypothetical protein